MLRPEIQQAVAAMPDRHRLPAALILAMVMVESGGDIYAWNPEPQYRYLWDVRKRAPFRKLAANELYDDRPPADFGSLAGDRDAEWWGQQASWGPLQVMGAVAREYGFTDHFPALCSLDQGLHYGMEHLARLRDRFLAAHGWAGVVAAYNAGSPRYASPGVFENQVYVDKVRKAGGFAFEEGR